MTMGGESNETVIKLKGLRTVAIQGEDLVNDPEAVADEKYLLQCQRHANSKDW